MAGGLAAVTVTGAAVTLGGIAQAGNPPPGPGNIEIFAARDMVMIDGYVEQAGQTATIKVIRGGQTVGIAQGVVDESGFLEVNHAPDLCWSVVTPNIRGGDLVEVSFSGAAFVDGAYVGSAEVTQVTASEVTPTPEAGDIEATVTIRGTYDEADVAKGIIDPSRFLVEVVNPDMREVGSAIGERAIAWGPGPNPEPIAGGYTTEGTFGGGEFSATFGVQSAADQKLVMAGEHIVMSWLADATNGQEAQLGLTAWESGNANGPGAPGCPPGPSAQLPIGPDAATLATTEGTGSIEVSWTLPEQAPDANDVIGYRISAVDASVATHRQEVSVEVDGAATTATIVNLTPGQPYEVQIEADNGQWSDPVTVGTATPGTTATTGGGTTDPGTGGETGAPTAAPALPTGVIATASADGGVDVSWAAVDQAASYEITAAATAAGAAVPAPVTVQAPATTASLTGLTPGTEYSVAVTASNALGTGGASAPVTVTTVGAVAPGAPVLTRVVPSHESVMLEWSAAAPGNPASPVTGYQLVATPPATRTDLPAVRAEVGAVTTGSMSGLRNGVAYSLQVFARTGDLPGPASTNGTGVTGTVTPNDVVTVSRAQYRADRREWRIAGTAADTTANSVTVRVSSATGAIIQQNVAVAADGSWSVDLRNGPLASTDNRIHVRSSSGGEVVAGVTRTR